MADEIDEKPRVLVDADTQPTRSGPSTPAADLPAAEQGSLNDTASSSDGETEVINLVNGVPRYLLAFGLMCALFCTAMDVTIIATAIPHITSDFHSIDDVGWYGAVYELSVTALQPTYGKLYTQFNLKWVFLSAIAIFELGSLVAALATDSVMLIFGRAIAGLGSAGVFSGTLAILAASIPLKMRARYIGLVTSMFAIAAVIGPFLGGVLTDQLSWRWCFWINLPLGAITILIVFFCFNPPARLSKTSSTFVRLRSFDYGGSILITAAVTCLLLMLQWGGIVYPWSNSKVWGTLIGFILLAICFVAYEMQLGEAATLPIRLLKDRRVWPASLCASCTQMMFYNHIYYLPFYFQAVKGTTAEGSGIHTLPYFISLALTTISTGFLISRVGSHILFLVCGTSIETIAAGLISTLTSSTSTGKWIGYQILAGFGSGIALQIPFIAIQATSKPEDVPLGMAIASFATSIGAALTISVGQNILVNGLREYIPRYTTGVDTEAVVTAGAGDVKDVVPQGEVLGLKQAYARSLDHTFAFAIAAAGLAVGFALFLTQIMKQRGLTDPNKTEEEAAAESMSK